MALNPTFVLSAIHIRQIGEVRIALSASTKQNRTKLPKRTQVLDLLN